jgi:hypothetical protein
MDMRVVTREELKAMMGRGDLKDWSALDTPLSADHLPQKGFSLRLISATCSSTSRSSIVSL